MGTDGTKAPRSSPIVKALGHFAQALMAGLLVGGAAVAGFGSLICWSWAASIISHRGFTGCAAQYRNQDTVPLSLASLLVSLPSAAWLLAVAALPNLRGPALYAVLNCLGNVLLCLIYFQDCDPWSFLADIMPNWSMGMFIVILALLIGLILVSLALIMVQLAALEVSTFELYRLRTLQQMWLLIPPLLVLLAFSFVYTAHAVSLRLFVCLCAVAWWTTAHGLIIDAFSRARAALSGAQVLREQNPPLLYSYDVGAPRAEAAQARQGVALFNIRLVAIVVKAVTSVAVIVWYTVCLGWWDDLFPSLLKGGPNAITIQTRFRISNWLQLLDTSCHTVLALHFSGATSRAALDCARAERRRIHRWLLRFSSQMAERPLWERCLRRSEEPESLALSGVNSDPEAKAAWEAKVKELAGRGITLRALLDFYRSLEEQMPNFSPAQHSTDDVVRQVILPLTGARRCSGAEVLMQDCRIVPDVLVTHSWSHRFHDLVAGICADALGEADYWKVAHLLTDNIELLEHWLSSRGLMSRGYWVSAFAVNQHLSKREGARGFAEQPACTAAMSETNKFYEMLTFLAAKNPGFAQVVIADVGFNVFTRAWCLAEIAEAKEAGVVQRIKLCSADSAGEHKTRLQAIKIEEAETSNAEDKTYILDSIEDLDAFNTTLRTFLLEELLPAWSCLDGEEQILLLGGLIRWHKAIPWGSRGEITTVGSGARALGSPFFGWSMTVPPATSSSSSSSK